MRLILTAVSVLTLLAGYCIGFIAHFRLDSPLIWIFVVLIGLIWFRPNKKQSIAIKGLLLVCGMTWAYVLVDIPLRLFYIHNIYQRLDEYLIQPWPEIPKLIRMKPNSSYDIEIIGDLAIMSGKKELAQKRRIRFSTDDRGFRNDVDQKGPYDVILLGDSIGAGAGTDQKDIASEILNNEFKVKAYNMSVPGTGPWNELLTLQEELQHINVSSSATVVWLIFSGNDLESLESRHTRPLKINQLKRNNFLKTQKVKLRVFRNKSPLKRILDYLGVKDAPQGIFTFKEFNNREIAFFNNYVNAALRPIDEIKNYPHMKRLEEMFIEMKNFTAARELKLVIMVHPTKAEVYNWLYTDKKPWTSKPSHSNLFIGLKDLAERHDISIHDLNPKMISESKTHFERNGEFLWWEDDTHPKRGAHQVTAESISDLVTQKTKI